jgi:hypothetical protein
MSKIGFSKMPIRFTAPPNPVMQQENGTFPLIIMAGVQYLESGQMGFR